MEYELKRLSDEVERLHEENARLLLMADSLPVLISYVDRDERFRFNNKATRSGSAGNARS